MIIDAFQKDNKLLLCGNGGSAADAQHIAAELSGRFMKDRKPLYAEALHVNSSYLTAVSNDYGFEKIFSRQLESLLKKGDVILAISTSGKSENVINGIKTSKKLGSKIILLTGEKNFKMGKLSDVVLNVPSTTTPRIQEAHRTIIHIICELVENELS